MDLTTLWIKLVTPNKMDPNFILFLMSRNFPLEFADVSRIRRGLNLRTKLKSKFLAILQIDRKVSVFFIKFLKPETDWT